ncbi:MAG TPA: hypothetical protein PLL09_09065 [Flavobacterium sp.]|uniref:DUF3311 domain-containing protein n=1 Tax=Flavobacterium azooxidireducens TaxID=1871076 RepID=A0ABY4KE21_9FLAO|nr:MULTISPECIES: hypothetical protein [Flavobacterium]PKP15181.1 MAG: hypothetical protein CVU07_11085 [Bacteroidetes bacterium HGW-Bacteroidetes-23]UPQ78794.1 hypothetical protein M0M57_14390 [Flavobacterium azooxidireducens]HRE77963.1 hypothetical protein [Flavobacterium sp.]
MKKRHLQKFVIISLLLWMAFNFPILLLFNKSEAIFGIPIIYFYIFSVWTLSIIISFYFLKKYNE